MEPATLNITVLAFAVALSLLSGLACGLIPAFHSLKPQLHIALKEGTRTTSGTGGQGMRRALVVAEIALAIVPLVGAGLLIRSFRRLLEVDPGFHHDHILAMEIDKSQPSALELNKLTTAERIDFLRRQSLQYDELMGRIQALPGVQAAGGITVLPLGSNLRSASRFLVEGEPSPADGVRPVAETRGISAGYFSAMGIPLRMGRLLDPHDYASQNVLVNEAFAKKFWPGGDAIGKRINFCSLAAQPCWMTIVGVVGNVHQYGLEAAPTFDEYGTGGWPPYAIIRTASDPAAGAQTVIAEIHKFDATLPVTHVMTVDDLLSESVSPRRFSTFLLGLFAGLALLLAMVGVYAVMSYAIRLRRTEIGVRMALGARPRDIWWLIIGGGARLIVGGIALGLGGAFAVTKLMSSLLYGVSATDPATFGAVAVLLAGVALLACYIPAHNAMRVDPMAALRSE
jgi:predicted permease